MRLSDTFYKRAPCDLCLLNISSVIPGQFVRHMKDSKLSCCCLGSSRTGLLHLSTPEELLIRFKVTGERLPNSCLSGARRVLNNHRRAYWFGSHFSNFLSSCQISISTALLLEYSVTERHFRTAAIHQPLYVGCYQLSYLFY